MNRTIKRPCWGWLCLLAALASNISPNFVNAQDEKFHSLFDGKTLTGWRGDEKLWRVEDGAIVGQTTDDIKLDANKFLVWDQGEVDDFALKVTFRISGTDRANSGVQVRSQQNESGAMLGYQADIDRSGTFMGITYSEKTGRGILCQRGEKVTLRSKTKKIKEAVADSAELLKKIQLDGWNEMEVTAMGNRIVIKINGNVTSEIIDEDAELAVAQGLIGLQLHVGPPMKIEFKDIFLKRLPLANGVKKVVFLAGKPSHGYGQHEHNAGCMLLANRLQAAAKNDGLKVLTTVYKNGWPADPSALDNADTVVSYCDGGEGHYLHHNGEAFESIMQRGTGLVCLHYGVEVPAGISGQRFLNWIGGYFEANWSVNPHWTARFENFPEHPVANGVQPFEVKDEWYYHMRFVPEMTRVTPILTALPPEDSLSRPDGPHSGNPDVREAVLKSKQPQHMGWAFVRGDGKGRGFGFTGGHFHDNWQNDDFRKVVLNAIVWTAQGDVPENGVASETPTTDELAANQDEPQPSK